VPTRRKPKLVIQILYPLLLLGVLALVMND
jgi:hypothetical protein